MTSEPEARDDEPAANAGRAESVLTGEPPLVAKPRATGLRRLVRATLFSVAGLRSAWRHEAAFREECLAAAVLLPLAFWVGQSGVERALLIGSCLLVLVVELLNSAIESAVDRVGTDHHALAGRAKDLASAAVLVSLVLAGAVWASIAFERFAGT